MKHLILFENFQSIDHSRIADQAIKNLSSYETVIANYRHEEYISNDIEDEEIENSKEFKNWLKYDFEFRSERVYDELRSRVQLSDGKIKIFRKMIVDDEWLKNPSQNMGIYWSYAKNNAETHWGDYKKKHTVTLEALVKFDKIDLNSTLLANLNPDIGDDEKEVTLFENTPIDLLKIWTENDEEVPFPAKQYFA